MKQKDRDDLAELIEKADCVVLLIGGHKAGLGPDLQRELVNLLRAKESEPV